MSITVNKGTVRASGPINEIVDELTKIVHSIIVGIAEELDIEPHKIFEDMEKMFNLREMERKGIDINEAVKILGYEKDFIVKIEGEGEEHD